MRVSELTPLFVARWIGIVPAGVTLDEAQTEQLSLVLEAAKAQASSFCGLSAEEMDEHSDITLAVLGICNDLWTSNRPEQAAVDMNESSKGILSAHSRNLL